MPVRRMGKSHMRENIIAAAKAAGAKVAIMELDPVTKESKCLVFDFRVDGLAKSK
jgi:nitrogenase subunit NifH